MEFDFKMYSCIGILGGTFNPIHNGHIRLCESAHLFYPDMEKIVFIPNNKAAYKDNDFLVSNEHRLNMIQLAVDDILYGAVSDIEIKRGGITYTYDTLVQIKELNPAIKIYLIIGSDSITSFHKWYRYKDVLTLCDIIVTGRDEDYLFLEDFIAAFNKKEHTNVAFLDTKPLEVSSTNIRERIKNKEFDNLPVPDLVSQYIRENSLYQ